MFDEAKRKIFPFHDGERERKADPLVIQRSLHRRLGRKLDEHLKALGAVARLPEMFLKELTEPVMDDMRSKEHAAVEALAAAAREAFGVKSLEDGGLADGECLDLLAAFLEKVQQWEDEARPLPDSPGSSPSTTAP